ncbi:MAG: TlpA family protein disulfide reductase [Candidatus Doudnabacteria bacterium]|nr:TlpA family protein disulfide reductase [Candidatus Doudnabacteria bacterium]
MKKFLIPVILIVLAAAGSLWLTRSKQPTPADQSLSEPKQGTSLGNKVPDFAVADYDGKAVKLSDFAGKPVFVNFWASWCPFCVEEMPLMAKIQQEFGDKYVTLAINRAERLTTAKEYSDRVGVTGKMILVLDDDDSVYRNFGYFAMPVSIFIDKNGVIRSVKQGPLQEEELRNKINEILQ